jgi:3-dehydrotetronate 4-kinase
MKLAIIADDFTGATDIASFLVESGLKTVQLNGTPADNFSINAEAIVISLKSRSCSSDEAISLSLEALTWCQARGADKIFFKYCSTFDSTEHGNIGPVTDSLMKAMDENLTVVCPALPVNGRTVFKGYLFVGDVLLNESGMQNHPINPMKDANLLRLMDRQSQGKTGLIDILTIREGTESILNALRSQKRVGNKYVVVDAISMKDLHVIAEASYDFLNFFTGGSGLGEGIAKHICKNPDNIIQAQNEGIPELGASVVLSGSCSEMTQKQVKYYQSIAKSYQLDMEQCIDNADYVDEVLTWYLAQENNNFAPLIYSTTDAQELCVLQDKYGREKSCDAIETFFHYLAKRLRKENVINFIVAGGETSGSIVQALEIDGFYIGPVISPGVPWVKSLNKDISLALKSGNFGDVDFFTEAQKFYRR